MQKLTKKLLVFERADGGITIYTPLRPPAEGEPEQMYLDRIALRVMLSPVMAGAVRLADREASALPANKRFRNCWRVQAGEIRTALPLARQQRMAELRAERNQRLAESDGEMLKANEQGGGPEVAVWKAYRRTLRDLPDTMQAALELLPNEQAIGDYVPTWPTAPNS